MHGTVMRYDSTMMSTSNQPSSLFSLECGSAEQPNSTGQKSAPHTSCSVHVPPQIQNCRSKTSAAPCCRRHLHLHAASCTSAHPPCKRRGTAVLKEILSNVPAGVSSSAVCRHQQSAATTACCSTRTLCSQVHNSSAMIRNHQLPEGLASAHQCYQLLCTAQTQAQAQCRLRFSPHLLLSFPCPCSTVSHKLPHHCHAAAS